MLSFEHVSQELRIKMRSIIPRQIKMSLKTKRGNGGSMIVKVKLHRCLKLIMKQHNYSTYIIVMTISNDHQCTKDGEC